MSSSNSVELDQLLNLDKLIHERVRLGIMTALSVSETLTFQELKNMLKTSDGNLSVHLRMLEKHGYLQINKKFINRKPQSNYNLTSEGKKAFKDYIHRMEKLIHQVDK